MPNPIDALNEETIIVTMEDYEAVAVATAILKRTEYFDANSNMLSLDEIAQWAALSTFIAKMRPLVERKATQYRQMKQSDLN